MSKVLISGEWLWPQYQEACALALESLGHEVIRFGWYQHFFEKPAAGEPRFKSFFAQRQNKYLEGPLINRINRDLLELAEDAKPDVVWFYNENHIFPRTLEKLKKDLPGSIFAQYSNDNPWATNQSKLMWRHLKRSVPLFDINFFHRLSNERDLRLGGAKRTALLRSYYIPEQTYPIDRSQIDDHYKSDVVFVGHFEDDGRLNLLADIAAGGVEVRLFGTGWNGPISRLPDVNPLKALSPVKAVRGEEYIKAICGSRISLCFLSKLNEDTYTRRNFEIPAMKAFMLSEYTEDLSSLYKEGEEVEFFRSNRELIEKITYYLDHDNLIPEIAQKGYDRVRKDGHDVKNRMRQFMNQTDLVRREKYRKVF